MSLDPNPIQVRENKRQLLVLELQCKAVELLNHMGGKYVAAFSVPFTHKDAQWSINVSRVQE